MLLQTYLKTSSEKNAITTAITEEFGLKEGTSVTCKASDKHKVKGPKH